MDWTTSEREHSPRDRLPCPLASGIVCVSVPQQGLPLVPVIAQGYIRSPPKIPDAMLHGLEVSLSRFVKNQRKLTSSETHIRSERAGSIVDEANTLAVHMMLRWSQKLTLHVLRFCRRFPEGVIWISLMG